MPDKLRNTFILEAELYFFKVSNFDICGIILLEFTWSFKT